MVREDLLSVAKPILFNTGMVRAILGGRKSATRRVIKPPYFVDGDESETRSLQVLRTAPKSSQIHREIGEMPYPSYPFRIGSYLYVRETWAFMECINCDGDYRRPENDPPCHDTQAVEYDDGNSISDGCFIYRAGCSTPERITWRPSIHMPKEAARIFLRVTDVRVERLKDMTLDNFLAEGVTLRPEAFNDPENAYWQARKIFSNIWDATIPKKDLDKYGFDANPWELAYEFERVEV